MAWRYVPPSHHGLEEQPTFRLGQIFPCQISLFSTHCPPAELTFMATYLPTYLQVHLQPHPHSTWGYVYFTFGIWHGFRGSGSCSTWPLVGPHLSYLYRVTLQTHKLSSLSNLECIPFTTETPTLTPTGFGHDLFVTVSPERSWETKGDRLRLIWCADMDFLRILFFTCLICNMWLVLCTSFRVRG